MLTCKLGYKYHHELHKMRNKVKMRDYKSEDFNNVKEFWELLNMGGAERKDDNEVIIRTIDFGAKLLILEKNKQIIGTSWITHDTRRSYLHHFGIHPKFQRLGYGKLLMNESIRFIRELNLQVKIEVHKKNISALNLYRNYSFIDFPEYELMMLRELS